MIGNSTRCRRALQCALAFSAATSACQPRPIVQPEPADACIVTPDHVPAAHTVFALTPTHAAIDPVQPLLGAQLYDTLVRVDCNGTVRPALATGWSDSAGIVWRFDLRRGVMFSDGSPLDAQAVQLSWTNGEHSVATLLASLTALGGHVLRVELRAPARVHLFADATFRVTGPSDDGLTAGTRGWRMSAAAPLSLYDNAGRALTLRAFGDAREAIDNHVHALTTADADVLAYAAGRAGYTAAPLPWTRTYAIATAGLHERPRLPAEILATLSRDVARGEVRPAQPPFWWESVACGVPGVRFTNLQARDIVYPRGDRAAQALAERIAALAWPVSAAPHWLREVLPQGYGGAGAPRVQALDERSLFTAVRARLPLAVIAAMPHMYDGACAVTAQQSPAAALLAEGWQLTPMLEARDVLLYRDGIGRVTVDAFGTLRFHAQ